MIARFTGLAAAAAAVLSVPPIDAATPRRSFYVLKEGTEVSLTNRVELSSKTIRVGDRFDVEVSEPVKAGAVTVVPIGTLGVAEVTSVEKNGHAGKSGKLDIRVLYLKLGDLHVPLNGQYHQEGQGGTAGAVGVAVVAGPFGLLVKGKSAVMPAGTQIRAFVKENTTLPGGR